jgi:hypothetical protein
MLSRTALKSMSLGLEIGSKLMEKLEIGSKAMEKLETGSTT